MNYSVKEIYYTLQGEGANSGRAAVFLRFSGCNLWTGLDKDRASGKGGCSNWCDTDFVGIDGKYGGKYRSVDSLVRIVKDLWPIQEKVRPLVVCTGGEPLLQLDEDLIAGLHNSGFEIAVETNGTIIPPPGIDWLTVSPKHGTKLLVTKGNELKLVYPQIGVDPKDFLFMEFDYFYLQPMDNYQSLSNIKTAIEYCMSNPVWRLGIQVHKVIGIA